MSPTSAAGCSIVRYLFQKRLERGGKEGFGSLPWGSYCRAADWAPGMNRSIVSAHLVTISSSSKSNSALEDCMNSVVVGSVTYTRASGSSTDMWTLRLRDTCLADSSLTGERSSAVMYLGPRSRASLTVREGSRKLACRTSIYDSSRLSTNKADPKGY